MSKILIFKFIHKFHQKKLWECEFSNFYMRNYNGLKYVIAPLGDWMKSLDTEPDTMPGDPQVLEVPNPSNALHLLLSTTENSTAENSVPAISLPPLLNYSQGTLSEDAKSSKFQKNPSKTSLFNWELSALNFRFHFFSVFSLIKGIYGIQLIGDTLLRVAELFLRQQIDEPEFSWAAENVVIKEGTI